MSNSFLYVANWERFQHYKDRRPPWIKLYLDLLSDDDWLDLNPSDRTLLMCVWMIAARDGDGSSKGRVRHDEGWLKAQAKTPKGSLKRLIDAGFLTVPASTPLAIRPESATPENREENGVGFTSEIEVSRRASLTQRSSSRARNEQWDGLVAVFGYSPQASQEQSLWGKLTKELSAMGATEPWIIEAGRRYDIDMPGVAKTPTALVKHAERLMNGTPKRRVLSAAGESFELARQLREAGR